MYFTAQELVDTLNQEEGEAMTVRKIRYYAQIDVLSSPELVNGKKKYTLKHLEELRAIRRLQQTGTSLEKIKASINGLDVQSLHKVSENANYFRETSIVDQHIVTVTSDVTLLLSSQVDEGLQEQLVQALRTVLQQHKGEC